MARRDLHELVLSSLGRSVVAGELGAGDVIRMEQLEEKFGVSRSVMREVIRVLVSMNLVTSRRSVGVTVRARTSWNPFDPAIIRWRLAGPDRVQQLQSLGELRTGIEPIAAQLAALRATPLHLGQLTAAVMGMSVAAKADDTAAFLRHDLVFHRTLLDASGNEMLAGLAGTVDEVLIGRAEHHLMPEPPERPAIELHLAVATAIQVRDPGAARAAMDALLEDTSRALRLAAHRASTSAPSTGAVLEVPRDGRTDQVDA